MQTESLPDTEYLRDVVVPHQTSRAFGALFRVVALTRKTQARVGRLNKSAHLPFPLREAMLRMLSGARIFTLDESAQLMRANAVRL